jgi:hypothetical protein
LPKYVYQETISSPPKIQKNEIQNSLSENKSLKMADENIKNDFKNSKNESIENIEEEKPPKNIPVCLTEKIEENPQNFTPINEKKQEDFSLSSLLQTAKSSILFDKSTNTANILDKEDNILAYKKDGVFDVALQELTKLVASINKGIYKIPESLENIPNQAPVVVSGGGQQSDNSMAYVLGGARDPIYEFRRSFRTS